MADTVEVEVTSITTGAPQTLYLDGKDLELVQGKNVLLVDDVISTGGSTEIAYERVTSVGAVVTGVIPMVDRGDIATERFAKRGVTESEVRDFNRAIAALRRGSKPRGPDLD